MSALTEEFQALAAELAEEFGEGLVLTLVEQTPNRRFDPELRRYVTDDPTVPVRTDVPAARIEAKVEAGGASLTRAVVPAASRADGTAITWRPGMKVECGSLVFDVHEVEDLAAGDGFAAHTLTLKRG